MKDGEEFVMKALLSVVEYFSEIGRLPKAKMQGGYGT